MDWTNLECKSCGANESNDYIPDNSKLGICKKCSNEKMINKDELCNHCFVFGK